eukprot:397192_1
MCKCFKQLLTNPYLKIVVKGIISFSIISGLYSWMSNVNEVKVWPDTSDQHSIWHNSPTKSIVSHNGLYCTYTSPTKNEQSYCNAMTRQIVNMTQTNSSVIAWKCDLFTNYSNKALYDDVPLFRTILILFIISASIST